MRNVILTLMSAAALVTAQVHAQEAFIWRTEDMTATVQVDDQYLRIGQYLHLEQRLQPPEMGWTLMKIDLPDSWDGVSVSISNGSVWLSLPDGARFQLRRDNVSRLDREILDGGLGKSDEVLHRLWVKHARTDG